MPQLPAPPTNDSLIETDETTPSRREPFYMAKPWIVWIQNALVPRVQAGASILRTVPVGGTTPLNTSIGATPLPLGVLAAGLYRVSYYARITVPDGVSSSLTVSIRWVESGVALVLSGAAMTGDSVTTVQSGTVNVVIDPNSPISYSTVYASNTPGAMKNRLTIAVEQISG